MSRPLGFVLLVLFAAGCHPGCSSAPVTGNNWRFDTSDIDESSGFAVSRTHEGIVWTHNDSGGDPVIFGVTTTGKLVSRVTLRDVENEDWEDITIDDAGNLYVGDFGNNDNERRDLRVFVIREPDPAIPEQTVDVVETIRFRYAEQTGFPDDDNKNFDSEALFHFRGRLYLLTKHRSDTRTVLYRFPESPKGEVALELLGEFDVGTDARGRGMVTSADVSPSGRLVVLCYHAIFVFDPPAEGDNFLANPPVHKIALIEDVTQQAEAVAWDGGAILLSNEQGNIHRIVGAPTTYP